MWEEERWRRTSVVPTGEIVVPVGRIDHRRWWRRSGRTGDDVGRLLGGSAFARSANLEPRG
ncbi:MAG: hypothetical protein CMJ52_05730 [Planctomycetaceae bacterium]|nr:hypothetical protein [Planctomycetaceae bacterium]